MKASYICRLLYLHVVLVSLQDLRLWVEVLLYEPVLHCCVGSYIFHGADWLTDWLTDWPAEITCMTTACTYTLHSTPFSSSATVHPYQCCRRAITQQTLPAPPPSLSLSRRSLNNPYSYSISDEWERERAKQLTPAPSAPPRFDVWGDSIVIDPEEGGGYGTATLIRQRRA